MRASEISLSKLTSTQAKALGGDIVRNDQQVLLEKMATGRTVKSNALHFGSGVMAIGFDWKGRLGLAFSKTSHFTDTANKM